MARDIFYNISQLEKLSKELFRGLSYINALVLHSQPARNLLQKLKSENPPKKEKVSNSIKQKSLQDLVEKVMIQKNITKTNKVKHKQRFKKISKKMFLIKMFTHKSNEDNEEDLALEEEISSPTYFSCTSSTSLQFYSARSSLGLGREHFVKKIELSKLFKF